MGGGGRATGRLAIRSMVWVKLRREGAQGLEGPCVYVMCTHITGGRFEDQFFVQQLSDERYHQPEKIMSFFNDRPEPSSDDVGILLGDFNSTQEYQAGGPMSGYFKSAIATSEGVKSDAASKGIEGALEDHFKAYMVSPFAAIKDSGWTFAYDQDMVGVTSGFGHLIDHMALSRPLELLSANVIYLTNQKFGNKPPDTDIPLTDHNSVKAVFAVK